MKVNNIKRILIPTDFSKTGSLAVQHAAFMAQLYKADLYLLHVIENADSPYNMFSPSVILPNINTLEEITLEQLNLLADTIRKKHRVTVVTICSTGSVSNEIVRTVTENKIDIVLMGTHGARGFK